MTTRLVNPFRPEQGETDVVEPFDAVATPYLATGNSRNWVTGEYPNLFSNMAGDKQVGLIVTAAWDVVVFIRDLATDTVTSTQALSGSSTAVAGMNLPINPVDAHWGAAVLWDAEGFVWIVGNSHSGIAYGSRPSGGINVIRSHTAVTTTLSGITWDDLTTSYPPPGWPGAGTGTSPTGINHHTYHQFERMPDGTSLWFVDQEVSLGTSRGRNILGFYKPPGTLNGWTPLVGQGQFQVSAADVPQGTTPDRAYRLICRVEERPAGPRVWYLGSWRLYDQYTGPNDGGAGIPGAPSAMKPFVIYSDNYRVSTSWKAVDGTSVTMPASWTTTGGISNSGATINTWNANVGGAAASWIVNYSPWVDIDSSGYPHYITQQDATVNYVHHWWNGTAWQVELCHTDLASVTPQCHLVGTNMHAFVSVGTRVFLHAITSNTVRSRQGPSTTEGNYASYGDPIRRRKGILDLVLPDGDTPQVASFGNHSRRTAS